MRIRRFVLTGAPGSGKTTLAEALRARGHSVVAEAATDLIARAQADGDDEPWRHAGFAAAVLDLQMRRHDDGVGPVRFFDRGPLCSVALARWLGQAEPRADTAGYERDVFLVRPLGFAEPTAARRITYAESLLFEQVHIDVYREHRHRLIDVPPVPVPERVALIERWLAQRGVRRTYSRRSSGL